VDRHEHVVCRRQLKRAQVRDFFRQLPPCLVAMEACGSAHYWARELRELGHTVRLIAPQFVKPYVKGDKHDAHDAEAICEAASRPSMRYVPVKSAEQQAVQSMHRVRSRLVRARTALCNEVRGLLGEFGLIATVAASAGDARQFRTGRQFAAWLGLVPRQHSTGGQQRLGNISKRGDTYLRTLLIHGARAVVRCCANKTDARSRWLQGLLQRRPANVVAVALANKNARILWALLSRETCYRPG
ncbi:IS110 family transposase, partial [Pseudomonas aeruginosa]|uniref:IS110 family transposase n=1 Tax=Pseudomonas aeruginosa TaxID=287 RepID=UPI00193C2E81